MEADRNRIALGEKNRKRIADAFARFQAEAGAIVAVVLDQQGLDPKDYVLAEDFSALVRSKPEAKAE